MNETTAAPDTSSSGPGWWGVYRAWPGWARLTTTIVVALVLALVVTAGVGVHLYRKPLPQVDGEAPLPGLEAAVEVLRDEHGIPRLYGDSDQDLVRAQGYVHAQERFFEMDVRRHATAGRLAELFGEEALASDKMVRTMGWRRIATRELSMVSVETRGLLDAYADGVNTFLKQYEPGDIALEYTLLGFTGLDYTPHPWTAVDSLAWLKAMAWDLRGNMTDEIARAVTALDNDARTVEQLWPAYDAERHVPVVSDAGARPEAGQGAEPATEPGAAPEAEPDAAPQARPAGDPTVDGAAVRSALLAAQSAVEGVTGLLGTGEGLGSNGWVVSGERTATGAPLLANDPHLGTSQPGIWMQMGLHCRERTPDCTLDVAGFTFSGLPGVVIGHNADIAWGFTNLGPDVTDLYLEKVDGDEWVRGGRTLPLRIRTETIRVRDGDDFELRVRETAHGPLISDVDQETSSVGANAAAAAGDEAYAVALAWTALRPGTTADAIAALNRASTFEEFREGARLFEVPSQNLLYADRAGNIGYQAPGRIPVRADGHDGRTPVAGWRRANDWQGWVDFDDLPSVLNPDEGFIVSANQAVVGDDFPHHLTDDWDRGYRSQRIRDLLEANEAMSMADMEAVQVDNRNPAAAALVPYLLALDPDDGYVSQGLDLLAQWNFSDDADSAAAAFFNLVWQEVLQETFHDDLRERVWPTGSSRWLQVVEEMLERPDHRLWDDRSTEDVVETRDDVLTAALAEARDEITRRQSVNPERWSWGRLHQLDLEHPSLGRSGIGVVERLFNRTGHRVSGGPNSPNAFAWDAAAGTRVTTAPSMRMVVSLDDFDESRWINLTGVSGHPASPHYDDQTQLFVEGESLPWRWSGSEVRDAAADRMVLTPRSPTREGE